MEAAEGCVLWGQVVLPDKVHQDRDEIIFLEEAHAAEDDTSAQQRGAVAALARVARDLPLERVLPLEFRPLFTSISEEATSSPPRSPSFPLAGAACALCTTSSGRWKAPSDR